MKRNLASIFIFFLLINTAVFSQDKPIGSAAPRKVTAPEIERDIAEALTLIQDNYVGEKKLDYNKLIKSSIESMLHTLDPHSNYFDAKEAEEFRTDQSSQYYGIGATIGDLRNAKGELLATYIKATFDGAPANRAGLRYGDQILEVNGESMVGKPFAEVRSFLRGPRGTTATIKFLRHGSQNPKTVVITRDGVKQPSIPEAYMIRPGVGYVAMTGGFHSTTGDEFNDAITSLRKQGMQNLVIDLRGNGGGLVREAYRIANMFLEKGQIVFTQKGRVDGSADSYRAENSNPDKTPIVLLVNGSSASASEIFAGALQDHDRALVVGENTFGKGLVQNPFPLDYGSMVLLTIAKYETPTGRLIQRDYSNGNLYDYYKNNNGEENGAPAPKGVEKITEAGRKVYGGGGIMPDEIIKPLTITSEKANAQAKLVDSLFAFCLDLAFGKVAGFENYKVDKEIAFNVDLKANDFPMSDALYQSYKKFAIEKYNLSAAQIDKERPFAERMIRTEVVTAAYGSQTAFQVFNEIDTQLLRSIELLPKAKELAIAGEKAYLQKRNMNRLNK